MNSKDTRRRYLLQRRNALTARLDADTRKLIEVQRELAKLEHERDNSNIVPMRKPQPWGWNPNPDGSAA